jgi:hypothetical protein
MARQVSIPDDRVGSAKELSRIATDLTDKEVQQTVQVINVARAKYAGKANTAQNLEAMRDEVLYRLAEINVLAEFDPTPCFHGEPPTIEIIGKIAGDPINKYGFDHERKRHEVLEAEKRGEEYRGQKEKS